MVRFELKLPEELLARIDVARGDVSRAQWLRRAAELALVEQTSSGRSDPSSSGSAEPVSVDWAAMSDRHFKSKRGR